MTCIRRPGTVWTQCTCGPCRADMARKQKRRRFGIAVTVDRRVEALEVVRRLTESGWTPTAICSAAGVPQWVVRKALASIKAGRAHRFNHKSVEALLNLGDPTAGFVSAAGTRRRLRGLALQGYGLDTLSELTGVKFSTLAMIRFSERARCSAVVHVAVRNVTKRIGLTVGDDERAQRHAREARWASLWAWDDIDDPAAKPTGVRRGPGKGGPRLPALDELVWLLDEIGEPIEQVAARFGVTVSGVEQALRRAA